MFKTIIVVLAVVAAAMAVPVPADANNRVERQVVYSSVAGSPYTTTYGALPYSAYSSGVYSGVSPYSVYSGAPLAYSAYNGVYNGLPSVRYY